MMKQLRFRKQWLWLLIIPLLLYACQPETVVETVVEQVEVTRVITETIAEEGESVEVTRVVIKEVPAAAENSEEVAALQATPAASRGQITSDPVPQQRLIIKDGRLTVIVDDTETAVNAATNLTVELGGYIISQNIHDDPQGYRFASLKLAVPVSQFEFALRDLRGLGQVTNESSSGTDVSDEFVDLNSRLTNLQLTRDRLRSFLDQATDVNQTLAVNEELVKVEEEIALIQGRLNFLRDRAAFSTIDLTINPWIPTPTATATATATPTPTATPLPTAEVWRPGDTAVVASVRLQDTAQSTADFLIFNGIVCGPWLLLLLLFGYPSLRLAQRWQMLSRWQQVIPSTRRTSRQNSIQSIVTGRDEVIQEEEE